MLTTASCNARVRVCLGAPSHASACHSQWFASVCQLFEPGDPADPAAAASPAAPRQDHGRSLNPV